MAPRSKTPPIHDPLIHRLTIVQPKKNLKVAPRSKTPPTYDPLIHRLSIVQPKKSDKVHVVVKRKKQRSEGVIDFGFVKDQKNGVTFKADKMKNDFKFIEQEIVVKSMYEPLRDGVFGIFGGEPKRRKRWTRTK